MVMATSSFLKRFVVPQSFFPSHDQQHNAATSVTAFTISGSGNVFVVERAEIDDLL
jgi:hypothetical protein